MPRGRPREDITERLWAKVDKSGECWVWTGQVQTNRGDYGVISVTVGPNQRTKRYVHRVAWEDLVGPIPDGMTLDHLLEVCSSTLCVRPSHLEVVSAAENARRQAFRNPAPSKCAKGHEDWGRRKKPSGTYARYCKECAREYQRGKKTK